MKNKTILIIALSAVAAILVVVVFVVVLNKKTATSPVIGTPTGSSGAGPVSTGASPDLVVVGSGTVSVIAPQVSSTQPYATTAPRVEPPVTASNGSGVALQPATDSSQGTASNGASNGSSGTGGTGGVGQVAYNYNQSDDSFLNEYYPDAQQVISGNEGPAGNAGQDPANQVLYTTGPVTPTAPVLSAPTDGFNSGTLPTSSNNSSSAILAYLQSLASATTSFDIVNNTNLITDPLQNLDATAAAADQKQAATILQAVQALTVPSDVLDVQDSYVDAYEQYITYTAQLVTLLNGGTDAIASSEGSLEATSNNISNVINIASTDYQNALAFYTQSTSGLTSSDTSTTQTPTSGSGTSNIIGAEPVSGSGDSGADQ